MPVNAASTGLALSLARTASLPSRTMTKKDTVPMRTRVGSAPSRSDCRVAVSTSLPSIGDASALRGAQRHRLAAHLERAGMSGTAVGPAGSTISLSAALPKRFSPSFSQKRPTRLSQPSSARSRASRRARQSSISFDLLGSERRGRRRWRRLASQQAVTERSKQQARAQVSYRHAAMRYRRPARSAGRPPGAGEVQRALR